MATQEDGRPCPHVAALRQIESKITEYTTEVNALHDSLQRLSRQPEGTESDHRTLAVHLEMVLAMEHLHAAKAIKVRITMGKILEHQMKALFKEDMEKAGLGARRLTNSATRENVVTALAGDLGPGRAEWVLERVEKWIRKQGWRIRYQA